MKYFTPILLLIALWACDQNRVTTGLDSVAEHAQLFTGKRVGIVTNHTAVNVNGEYITDIFLNMPGVTIAALFGPEHGIRGQIERGKKIGSTQDSVKNITIYSLYGDVRKPTPEMLKDVDVLVFDIQDVGARYYTHISTMAWAMEAAAEQGIPFVVLDRPNPINGIDVEGNVLDPAFATFVGLYPIPVRFGMTMGELATMFNSEGWLKNGIRADLSVIPLRNWQRDYYFDQTGLPFVKPSPNIPDLNAALAYPGTCLLEGTNISEGRGTTTPFTLLGAPWIDGPELAAALNTLRLPGVQFRDTTFTPVTMPGAALHPKHQDRTCSGVKIVVTERTHFKPYITGIHIVNEIHRLYADSLTWHERHFDRLCGTDAVRQTILTTGNIDSLAASWQGEFQDFLTIREKYLIYATPRFDR